MGEYWNEYADYTNESIDKREVFAYLDTLRESGMTNMFDTTSYIQDEFGLSRKEARNLLLEWMRFFAEQHGGHDA